MKRQPLQPILGPALFLLIAGIALLGIGAFRVQHSFQTRGIPTDFPGMIAEGGARLGINVYLAHLADDELQETLSAIKQAGFTTVKHSFHYNSAGDVDWESSDRLMTAVAAHGLEIVPLLDGDPANQYAPPADPATFAEWAGAFAERYADQLTHYIIWDEPNLRSHWGNSDPNPAEYGALLAATADKIRQADGDAVIVAAPLAPTTEAGPENLSETLFLEELYAAGASDSFDVISGKPYGFDSGPLDRRVSSDTLNFSRIILLRELLEAEGDMGKAVWAGNFGWNSLPESWTGEPSIWGQTDEQTQGEYLVEALARAQREWPWMGHMFLENWEAGPPLDSARWGFSIAGRPAEDIIGQALAQAEPIAYPGFHLASPAGAGQEFEGAWRFSPDFGADIGQTGDRASYRFWGTEVALRVRRADYRARLYVTIDGEPANALPNDGRGAALVLGSGDPAEDYLSVEPVARNLPPGEHLLSVEAWRGWDQWALNGYTQFERPDSTTFLATQIALTIVFFASLTMALISARRVPWLELDTRLGRLAARLDGWAGVGLTFLVGAIVAVAGWLTWGAHLDGVYRRLGDVGQLALTASAAALFYVTPSFFLLAAALLLFFLLAYARPAWGMVVIAFSIPFYVLPKPLLGYRFSPVEIFLLVTAAAAFLRAVVQAARRPSSLPAGARLRDAGRSAWLGILRVRGKPDLAVATLLLVATVSLIVTTRLDVATNEWRVVILEPALFYLLFRTLKLRDSEVWAIVDGFVLGGVTVAVIGLWQYARGENVITVVGGLERLRSIYGSPNNVALYLGRIVPFLLAVALMGGQHHLRRIVYGLALAPVGLALLLTFSRGALFLGLPAVLLVVVILWRYSVRGRLWPWFVGMLAAGGLLIVAAAAVPGVAGRLSLQGVTSFVRIDLWRSSLSMFLDHPFLGVGLDNFLYAYRERYILDSAWEEPSLSHPHNVVLDFATRLGLAGLLVGIWLFAAWALNLYALARVWLRDPVWSEWKPLLVALAAAFAQTFAHGLVDQSFFLVDLAFAFFLMLGLTLWLAAAAPVASCAET